MKASALIPVSWETWVDAGNEPPPGYWQWQEKKDIRLRGTTLWGWLRYQWIMLWVRWSLR